MSAAFPAFLGKHQKAKCNALTNRGRVVTREHPLHFFFKFLRAHLKLPARAANSGTGRQCNRNG